MDAWHPMVRQKRRRHVHLQYDAKRKLQIFGLCLLLATIIIGTSIVVFGGML